MKSNQEAMSKLCMVKSFRDLLTSANWLMEYIKWLWYSG